MAKRKFYKDILPNENPDDRFYMSLVNRISPYTMTLNDGLETTYELFQAVKYVVQNRLAGDVVECGVWRGGSMMLMAHALQHFGDMSRQLYLYDTYAGMTEPDDVDIDYDGNAMKPIWNFAAQQGLMMGAGEALDGVKANMRSTGYPESQMHFIAGNVLETIPAQLPSSIALVRLDTDWYKSTLHELQHLYDLIVPNGVLIIDDYGWCRGARKATDEFFSDRQFKPLMHRIDQGPRMIVKPA
jgi:O-methyltransferase